jgi:hypothetical protein
MAGFGEDGVWNQERADKALAQAYKEDAERDAAAKERAKEKKAAAKRRYNEFKKAAKKSACAVSSPDTPQQTSESPVLNPSLFASSLSRDDAAVPSTAAAPSTRPAAQAAAALTVSAAVVAAGAAALLQRGKGRPPVRKPRLQSERQPPNPATPHRDPQNHPHPPLPSTRTFQLSRPQQLDTVPRRDTAREAQQGPLAPVPFDVTSPAAPVTVLRPPPPPGRGFDNLGNTCFINATVQCLVHTGHREFDNRLQRHPELCP